MKSSLVFLPTLLLACAKDVATDSGNFALEDFS